MAMTLYQTNIYSNDGSTLLWSGAVSKTVSVTVTATGASFYAEDNFSGSWVYSGSGIFRGLATRANGENPIYGVGSSFYTGTSTLNLYIVEEKTGGTVEGTSGISGQISRLRQAVADAYTAVDSKGGTLPQEQVSGNLAEAIQSIRLTCKRIAGTLTTNDTDGSVAVSLGFRPDIVFFTDFYYTYSYGRVGTNCPTAYFAELREGAEVEIECYDEDLTYFLYPEPTEDGFYLDTTYVKEDRGDGQGKTWHYATNKTLNYVAVKYTQ